MEYLKVKGHKNVTEGQESELGSQSFLSKEDSAVYAEVKIMLLNSYLRL